jgi:glutathione S-transferase
VVTDPDLTRPSIRRYRRGEHLSAADIAIIRVWLRAWLDANHRHTPGVTRLLAEVDEILSRAGVDWWVERARDVGLHPFPDEVVDK